MVVLFKSLSATKNTQSTGSYFVISYSMLTYAVTCLPNFFQNISFLLRICHYDYLRRCRHRLTS